MKLYLFISSSEYSFRKLHHYQALIRRVNGIVLNTLSINSIVQVEIIFILFTKKTPKTLYHLSGVEDSISFAIFTLSIIGFFLLTVYTVRNLINKKTKEDFHLIECSGLRFDCITIIINAW